MSIAERIFFSRKQQRLTQEELAKLVGVTKSACGQWERGITSLIVENIAKLAVVLDVYFEWLATGRGKMNYPSD